MIERNMFRYVTLLYLFSLCLLSYYLPFSLLFNLYHQEETLLKEVDNSNIIRTENSRRYFSSINSSSSMDHYTTRLKGQEITFAVGIITIKRANEHGTPVSHGYLLQSASALDSMLKEKPIFNNSVGFICNVHSYPSQHTDAVELYSYIPYIERYGENSMGISDNILLPNSDEPFKDINQHRSLYQKETYDYTFCLQAAAKLNPQFILLIEEDTIPHKDFPEFLDHLIHFRLKDYDLNDLTFVKFYFPSKWQGFSFSFSVICDLISFCSLGAPLLCLFDYYYLPRKLTTSTSTIKVFIVGFIISFITCYVLGRQNLNEMRRLSNHSYRMKESEQCCTQAMLYPFQVTKDLPLFMISESLNTHVDLIITDYVAEKDKMGLQIEPNLFYHTGYHSSLPMVQKHPIEFLVP